MSMSGLTDGWTDKQIKQIKKLTSYRNTGALLKIAPSTSAFDIFPFEILPSFWSGGGEGGRAKRRGKRGGRGRRGEEEAEEEVTEDEAVFRRLFWRLNSDGYFSVLPEIFLDDVGLWLQLWTSTLVSWIPKGGGI